MTTLRIDQLKLRFRGVSPQDAYACTESLGREVLTHFFTRKDVPKNINDKKIKNINAGVIEVNNGTKPPDLQRAIASRMVEAIGSNRES